jgi:hypothetical protein
VWGYRWAVKGAGLWERWTPRACSRSRTALGVKTGLRLGGRKPSALRCRTLSSGLDALACSLYFVVAPASARWFDEGVWLVRLGRLHGISYGLWGVAVANVQQSSRVWIAWPTDRADGAPC